MMAQLISVITAPVLYRIYDNEDYGSLGLFIASAGVVGVFSTLQLTQPILLEKKENDALAMFDVVKRINWVVALVVLIMTIGFIEVFPKTVDKYHLYPWLYLLPLSIYFSGQNQILRTWANRVKAYRILMVNTILTALLVPIFSISIGLIKNGPLGLFVGLLISQIVPPIIMYFKLNNTYELYSKNISIHGNLTKYFKRHVNFPKYAMPAELLSTVSHQLPVFMLGAFSGVGTVGLYNLANRMLGLPSTILSSSVGEVYRQKATEAFHKKGHMTSLFYRTMTGLALVALPVFIAVILFGPDLFAFVFGENWRASGQISRILAVVFMLRFVNSPLSYVIYIRSKQHIDLLAGIWFLISSFLVFYFMFRMGYDYMQVLTGFAINFTFLYSILIWYNYKLSVK